LAFSKPGNCRQTSGFLVLNDWAATLLARFGCAHVKRFLLLSKLRWFGKLAVVTCNYSEVYRNRYQSRACVPAGGTSFAEPRQRVARRFFTFFQELRP
jgi:hypothetical protein